VIEVWDWNVGLSSDFIGEVRTSLSQLLECHERQNVRLPLLNSNMLRSRGYKHSGLLHIGTAERLQKGGIIDYLPSLKVQLHR
jgi:hypothetical protein